MQLLVRYSGAVVRRVIDRSRACVPEHAHDWPLLSIYVLGSYLNRTEIGDVFIAGPSAIFYGAGAVHQNSVAHAGFEQIEIEFDPAWLGSTLIPDAPVTRWIGTRTAVAARDLVRLCTCETKEKDFRAAVQRFMEQAIRACEGSAPNWIAAVRRRLYEDTKLRVACLAKELGRHPSWIGVAYKRATGEGMPETAARLRVERAARLLRETNLPLGRVAVDAGFCDQSHMNRTFRRILDRLPSAVREDRHAFRQTCA